MDSNQRKIMKEKKELERNRYPSWKELPGWGWADGKGNSVHRPAQLKFFPKYPKQEGSLRSPWEHALAKWKPNVPLLFTEANTEKIAECESSASYLDFWTTKASPSSSVIQQDSYLPTGHPSQERTVSEGAKTWLALHKERGISQTKKAFVPLPKSHPYNCCCHKLSQQNPLRGEGVGEATVAVQQELGASGHCTPANKKQAEEAMAVCLRYVIKSRIPTQRMFLPSGKWGLLTPIT